MYMIIQDFPRYCRLAELEVRYKAAVKASRLPRIFTSRAAYQLLMKFWDKDKIELVEEFKIILLRNGFAFGICSLSSGTVNHTVVDPKLVYGVALKTYASQIILAHNHPSGVLKASQSDLNITEKIVAAGKLLEIQVYDHLIVTTEGYCSLMEEGVL